MNETSLRVKHRKGCNRKTCMDGFAERFRQLITDANVAGQKMREADFPNRQRKDTPPATPPKGKTPYYNVIHKGA